jgi:hypothetical protein
MMLSNSLQPTSLGTVNCWTNSATTKFDWNASSTGTPSSGTVALSANSGTKFFYTEASVAGIGNVAILVTPEIDLSGLTVPMLSFYYHMYGAQIGTLNIEVTDDLGLTWDPLIAYTVAQQCAQARRPFPIK